MKELFQLSFRCTKMKCGVIWAFVVMFAPGTQRERHLGSAACHVPCKKPSRGARRAAGALRSCSFFSCRGRFVQSRRFHVEHKYKLNNLWNPSWKVLRMFNICIYFYCFTFVLFSLGIQQALYFSLILSRCNFFVQIKMLWHCILQL